MGGSLDNDLIKDFVLPSADDDSVHESENGSQDGDQKSLTNRSKMGKSVKTGKSRGSKRSKLSNQSEDSESQRHVGHPFERLFNKEIVAKMKKASSHLVRLTFGDFKSAGFEPFFPAVINDLLEYLTGFNVEEFARQKREKEEIQQGLKMIEDQVE
jgi:hypothetical protein